MKKLVHEWNQFYKELGREVRLKDLSDNEYEDLIVESLYDHCGKSWSKAYAVLTHKDCTGGWMLGDPMGKIASNMKND